MLAKILLSSKRGRSLVKQLGDKRALDVIADISEYLDRGNIIVDVGAGTCQITELLLKDGFDVTPVDVDNLSCVEGIEPILFDGQHLPFTGGSFDLALLINVLHHVRDPDELLQETARVASCMIVHEDIYTSKTQEYLTKAMDSILNLEFIGHPHSNRNDQEWRDTFVRLNLRLKASKYKKFWSIFSNATYLVGIVTKKRP
jgi:2-polyprenyl-3-methyl-5-hydroxy-6-metoxy-1,4-benzoquinol methylase